jgi:hypothetical protein
MERTVSAAAPGASAIALGTALIATIALLSSAVRTSAAPLRQEVIVHVNAWQQTFHFVNNTAPPAVSKGDVMTITDKLSNPTRQFGKPKGTIVGRDTETQHVLSSTQRRVAGTAVLPGGTIRYSGISNSARSTLVVSVTGGTGRYKNATGSRSQPSSYRNPYNRPLTFRLSLP